MNKLDNPPLPGTPEYAALVAECELHTQRFLLRLAAQKRGR